jgi:hypothetical protein
LSQFAFCSLLTFKDTSIGNLSVKIFSSRLKS